MATTTRYVAEVCIRGVQTYGDSIGFPRYAPGGVWPFWAAAPPLFLTRAQAVAACVVFLECPDVVGVRVTEVPMWQPDAPPEVAP